MVAICMIYLCLLSQVLGKIMAPFEDHNMGTLSGELTRAESSEAQVGRTYLRRLESNSQSSSYSHSMGYSSSASYSGSMSGYSSMSYSGSMSSLSYSSLSYSSLSFSSLSYSSLSYSSFYSFSQLSMSTPTTMPTGIPSAEPSGLPTGIPTLEPTGQPTVQPTGEPTEFVVEIEVKVGHTLNGFPSTDYWYQHKALELAYRRTVADRVGVELQFVSEVNVTDVYVRRRLQEQTISGITTEVDVQIPNPESGATQDDVTANVAAALSDEPAGSEGGSASFLDAFVDEVEEVSEEAQISGDTDLIISSDVLDETVGAVEAIESNPVEVKKSIMTVKPTSRPTSVPTLAPVNSTSRGDDDTTSRGDDDKYEANDFLVIIIVSVIGGLTLLGLGGYYMLTQTALKSVMPVKNLAQEDVASSSIVPGPG